MSPPREICEHASLGDIADIDRGAADCRARLERIGRTGCAGSRAAFGKVAGSGRCTTLRAGVAGRMCAGAGSITLIERAGVVIARACDPGARRTAVSVGAGKARLDLAGGRATVAGCGVAVVAGFPGRQHTVAAQGIRPGIERGGCGIGRGNATGRDRTRISL